MISKTFAWGTTIGGVSSWPAAGVFVEELDKPREELGGRRLREFWVAGSGSSGGAVAEAMAAVGLTGFSMTTAFSNVKSKRQWEDWNKFHLINMVLRGMKGFTGLMEGKLAERWITDYLGQVRFCDLGIPLYIATYDYNCEYEVMYGPESRAEVAQVVRGSIAIPGGFEGKDIKFPDGKDHKLGDGGIACAVPILPLLNHNPDRIIIIDSAGATEPVTPKPWQSANEKTPLDIVSGAVRYQAAKLNMREMELARERGADIRVYKVHKGMSMSDPAGTFPEAYREADAAMREFVKWNLLT